MLLFFLFTSGTESEDPPAIGRPTCGWGSRQLSCSLIHHHLPCLPLWSVNRLLETSCQRVLELIVIGTSTGQSDTKPDNTLSLGNFSQWHRLLCQPPPVTRQHGKACVLCLRRGYSWSFGCCSLSPSGGFTVFCPGDGAWGGCVTAGGRVCAIGTALATMPSTGGGRPPDGKFTTPGGYLEVTEMGRE